jgi:hypothetical protein
MTKRTLCLAAAAATLLVAGAAPARADDDVRRGFENQAGRLLAVEAFRFGHAMLWHAHGGPVVVERRIVVDRHPHHRQHFHGKRCDHRYGRDDRHHRHGGFDRDRHGSWSKDYPAARRRAERAWRQ